MGRADDVAGSPSLTVYGAGAGDDARMRRRLTRSQARRLLLLDVPATRQRRGMAAALLAATVRPGPGLGECPAATRAAHDPVVGREGPRAGDRRLRQLPAPVVAQGCQRGASSSGESGLAKWKGTDRWAARALPARSAATAARWRRL